MTFAPALRLTAILTFLIASSALLAQEEATDESPTQDESAEAGEDSVMASIFAGFNRKQLLDIAEGSGFDPARDLGMDIEDIRYDELVDYMLERYTLSVAEPSEVEEQVRSEARAVYNRLAGRSQEFGGVTFRYDVAFTQVEPDALGVYKIVLFGHTKVDYGGRTLEADMLIVNFQTGDSAPGGSAGESSEVPDEPDADEEVIELETGATGEDPADEENPEGENDGESEGDLGDDDGAGRGAAITEILGVGNIRYEDSANRLVGDKFFFYFESQRIIVYRAKSLLQGWYISADAIKRTDTTRFVVNDAVMSICNLEHPHFLIRAPNAWFYQDELIVVTNPTYEIAGSTFFYFPFLFQSEWGSGIQTAFAFERGTGFYINNTYRTRILDTVDATIHFDYFQKLGFYSMLDINYDFISARLMGGYTRAVEVVSGDPLNRFTNTFDFDSDGNLDQLWNWRYSADISTAIPLAGTTDDSLDDLFAEVEGNEDEATNRSGLTDEQRNQLRDRTRTFLQSLTPTLNISFYRTSDPFFESTFNGLHREQFDLRAVVDYRRQTPPNAARRLQIESGGRAQSLSVGTSASLGNLISLSIDGGWDWTFDRNIAAELDPDRIASGDRITPYRPQDAFRVVPSAFRFPRISLSSSGTIIDNILGFLDPATRQSWFQSENGETADQQNQNQEQNSETVDQPRDDGSIEAPDPNSEQAAERQRQEAQNGPDDGIRDVLDIASEVQNQRDNTFSISLPLSYNASFNFADQQDFFNNGTLRSQSNNLTLRGGYSLPFSLRLGVLNISASHNLTLNFKQKTFRNPTPAQAIEQDNETFADYSTGVGGSIGLNWGEDDPWLQGNFSGRVDFSASGRFDPLTVSHSATGVPSAQNDSQRQGLTYGFNIDWVKTSFGLNFRENLRLPWNRLVEIGQQETGDYFNRQYCIDTADPTGPCTVTRENIIRSLRDPVTISISSTPFDQYLSINFSYSEQQNLPEGFYDVDTETLNKDILADEGYIEGLGLFSFGRFTSRAESLSVSISSSVTDIPVSLFDGLLNIESLSFSASYNHSFIQPQNHTAQMRLSMRFTLGRDWSFDISSSTQNNRIYDYINGTKDVLIDLLQSINFFDPFIRSQSNWKMGGIQVGFSHSLHKWTLSGGFSFQPSTLDGRSIWLPQFNFSVTMNEGGGFSAPPIQTEFQVR